MNNPNSALHRAKRGLVGRWSAEDYPGGEPRFQIKLFAKDLGVFVVGPVLAIFIYDSFRNGASVAKRPQPPSHKDSSRSEASRSQIIVFDRVGKWNGARSGVATYGVQRKAPGALVKIKLLNVVETYSTAPVHAQIIDRGLGESLLGGVLIGDATPDPAFERINITFRFVRDPNRDNVAIPITARALSLNGTLGLNATKKEGFFARSAFASAAYAQDTRGGSTVDLKEILLKALTVGLSQEASNTAQTERNRSQVLTLQPSMEFFAELTDFFPGGAK